MRVDIYEEEVLPLGLVMMFGLLYLRDLRRRSRARARVRRKALGGP